MIEQFQPGILTHDRLNELVDAVNALKNLKVSPAENAPARFHITDGNTLLEFNQNNVVEFLVCGIDGLKLIRLRVESITDPPP